MFVIFLSPPLYTDFVRPPKVGDPIPDYILDNPKLFPFFEDALGAIDGLHFNAFAASDQDALHDRNDPLTTNALVFVTLPCDFSIPRAAGKGLLLMPRCFTIPV